MESGQAFGPELGMGQEYSSASSKPDKSGNPLDQEVISPVKEEVSQLLSSFHQSY